MNNSLIETAQTCLTGAESNTMTFPEIVGTLIQAGFESYMVDFRRATATYYLPSGDAVELSSHRNEVLITETLDVASIKAAITEAQQLVSGYTYAGFCAKVMAAGCAGYIVSFSGRRAVYFGRTAEIHTEHFPQ